MKPSRTVLIVEDNPALAESMSFALSTFGWTVVGPAHSVEAALSAAAVESFSVAVLDVDLGPENSFPIAEYLRDKGIPFVFLTGYEGDAGIPKTLRNETCFVKPLIPETLIGTLERLVDESLTDV